MKVFSSAFVALWLLLPPPVVAGTDNQKQALAEYQTSALYKDVLSYYNPTIKEFSESIYDDEVAIGKVNELFLVMVRDEGFPINVTPDIRDKLDSSLAMVELEYPESERMALYKKLDCSVSVAGFALEGIGCGLGNFNRLSGATLLELTTNTLLLAPLTALDFVTVGGGTTAKVAVKASTKSSKLSLLKKLAGKRSVELATKMRAKITKVRAALGRGTLHYFKSSAHLNRLSRFITSKPFKHILYISQYVANTVSNSSPDGLTKEQINDLKKMKVVLDEYAKTCSSEFSEEICEVFVKETQSDFEKIFVFGADTGKLVLQLSGILDSKLVALLYDGFRTGILDYLDDDNVEVMKDIVEIGKVGVELLPYVGATAAYINSNAKASKEVRDAIGKEIAEYLLWSNEKQRLQKSILVKYELMVIANSINLITRDTHFVFQEINPKRAVGKSVSPIAVIEATNYQIAQDKDLNKIIQYVRMAAKDNCMANGKQLVFTTNEFDNFIPISVAVAADCKTVTYSTLSTYHGETYTGIPFIATFNVKDNTVQYAPPDEKIYSDVNNGELNKYLLALTREGVLYGEEGKFHSGRPASKAEFYAMVARLFYPKDDWGQDASLGVRYKTFLEAQLKQSFLSTEYTSDITYNEAADLVYRIRKHKGLEPEAEKKLTECETSLNWSKESYQLYDTNILSLPKAYYKPPKIGVDIPDFTFKLCFNSSPKKEAKTAFMFPYDASMNRDQMAKLLYRAKYGKETW